MALDKSEVQRIAHLARLPLSEADLAEVSHRISDILTLIDKMQAVDTSGVEALAHPLDAVQRLRADTVTESDQRDELQSLAPHSERGLYLVPRVIE